FSPPQANKRAQLTRAIEVRMVSAYQALRTRGAPPKHQYPMSEAVDSTPPAAAPRSDLHALPAELLLRMHELMLTSRVLEERRLRMQRQGDGFFWLGGRGEEAFNVALGLLVKEGRGLDHDYLHLHYRSSPTLVAMGADPVDSLRLMANSARDPYTAGRNF